MSETINFTIPRDPAVMRAVADYLERIAERAEAPTVASTLQAEETIGRYLGEPEPLHLSQYPETAKLVAADALTWAETGAPGTVEGDTVDKLVPEAPEDTTAHVTGGMVETEEAAPPPPATDSPTLNDEEIKEIAASVPPPNVDTAPDSTGVQVPWDVRIHSGAKTQYALPRVGWKLKRGVSGALLETVEAELRAVMAASPANPVTATTDAATAFGATEEAAPPPPATDAETTAITNFAELNAAITGNAIDPVTVLAAVKKVGLAAYPLLAAREDLLPLVVAELFPSKEG